MGKKDRGDMIGLDSLLDIMTCLVGVLMLVIILTGIDASQVKMIAPTPMKVPSDLRPVFIECSGNRMYYVPVDELHAKADEKLKELAEKVQGDSQQLFELLSSTTIEEGGYKVDLTFALLAQYALERDESAVGVELTQGLEGPGSDFLKKIFSQINPEEQMLTFLVRDDSYKMFRRARTLAWGANISVAYTLLDIRDPIRFGVGGTAVQAQ